MHIFFLFVTLCEPCIWGAYTQYNVIFFSYSLSRLSIMYESSKQFQSRKIHLQPQYPLIVFSNVGYDRYAEF